MIPGRRQMEHTARLLELGEVHHHKCCAVCAAILARPLQEQLALVMGVRAMLRRRAAEREAT